MTTALFPCRTPLHCAASCNSVHLCKMLVESGAAIFATTISDVETAADKCEEMEEGYTQCSQFLYGGFLCATHTSTSAEQLILLDFSRPSPSVRCPGEAGCDEQRLGLGSLGPPSPAS